MNLKVSRSISSLVLLVAAVVIGYISWGQMRAQSGAYPMASVGALKAEFSALSLAPGASAEGELKLVDRLTLATLDQKYVSTNTRDELAKHYEASFRANGWATAGALASNEDAIWFCKKGIHGGVVFLSESTPVVFRVSMATGGWASSKCG